MDIEELEEVTPAIASRLRDAGINTVENLITYTTGEVAGLLGVKGGLSRDTTLSFPSIKRI